MVLEVRPPGVDRHVEKQLAESLHRVQLAHDELRLRVDAGGGEQRLPVEPGHQPFELGARARVVGEVALAALGRRPLQLRDARLDLEDALRLLGRVRLTDQGEHARDMRAVLLAHRRIDRIGLEVVVAVGQPEPALGDDDGVAVGVLLVRSDRQAQRREQRQVRAPHQAGELVVVAGPRDRIDAGTRGHDALRIDGGGVDEGAVIVTHLLRVAALGGIHRQRVHHFQHLRARALVELIEGAPAGAIRRDLVRVEPVPVGVAIEVIPGTHLGVTRAQVQSPGRDLRLRRRRGGQGSLGRRRSTGDGGQRQQREQRHSGEHRQRLLQARRQAPHANSSQPAIHATPPRGVSAPSRRGAPNVSA